VAELGVGVGEGCGGPWRRPERGVVAVAHFLEPLGEALDGFALEILEGEGALLQTWGAALDASGAKESPVTRVVKLLEEMKEQLPTIEVVGNSIKVKGEHSMPYDERQYDSFKMGMQTTRGFELSHDLYIDLDMWVKNPSMKLLDVYTGMKAGVSARVSEGILQMLSGMFEAFTSKEESVAPVKAMLGDDYESVIEKLKTMLKGNEVTISVPGFDKMKEQMAKDKEDGKEQMTFNEAKAQFEEQSKAMSMTGNEYAVAALNLVQQAAAANLRFSSATVSMYDGAVKVAWTLDGIPFFNTLAHAAEETGADKLIYGSKKAEEYKIPGVQSEEQIVEIKELGKKDDSGAFANSCHALVLAMVVALMS